MDPLLSIVDVAAFFVIVLVVIGLLAVTHGTDSRPGFGDDAGRHGTRGDWV